MPDRLRERLTLWGVILSIVTSLSTGLLWASGKVGIVVAGPPELIAGVRHDDSLRASALDSALAFRVADAAKIHTRMDSIDRDQDARIRTLETLASQQMALSCVNTKPRDLVLVRIPCGQYVGRWKAPGATP